MRKQNNLKEVRTQKGLTQRAIANAAGTSERVYQDYEYGRRTPNVYMAIRIAKALGTDVTQLFPLSSD